MAEIKRKLITPRVPNFILIESEPVLRQDGWKELPKVPVGDLTDETLEEIVREWRIALFRNAERQRETGQNE